MEVQADRPQPRRIHGSHHSDPAAVHHTQAGTVPRDARCSPTPSRSSAWASSLGLGEKKMSEAAVYVMPMADRVNFGFYHGAALEDPAGLLEGTGKRLRHMKVRSLAEADDPALRTLVRRAVAERRAALGQ